MRRFGGWIWLALFIAAAPCAAADDIAEDAATPEAMAGDAAESATASVTGKVIGITDGDTFGILTPEKKMVTVRLYGADAPERGQPFGREAQKRLSDLVRNREVTVEVKPTEGFGPTFGVVTLPDGRVLNREMLEAGLAWWDRETAPDAAEYEKIEADAKEARRGLWSAADPVPPWEYRTDARAEAVKRAEEERQAREEAYRERIKLAASRVEAGLLDPTQTDADRWMAHWDKYVKVWAAFEVEEVAEGRYMPRVTGLHLENRTPCLMVVLARWHDEKRYEGKLRTYPVAPGKELDLRLKRKADFVTLKEPEEGVRVDNVVLGELCIIQVMPEHTDLPSALVALGSRVGLRQGEIVYAALERQVALGVGGADDDDRAEAEEIQRAWQEYQKKRGRK